MLYLTLEERRVLVFLFLLLVIGCGLNYLKKTNSSLGFSLKDISEDIKETDKFDLNKIDKDTLICLPGIGEKIASRIIEYREKYTRFKELEELKRIKGIKPSCYERLKLYLYVE